MGLRIDSTTEFCGRGRRCSGRLRRERALESSAPQVLVHITMSSSEMPSSRDRPYGQEPPRLPCGCVFGAVVVSRLALLVSALLVISGGGGFPLPWGFGFGRFLNASYIPSETDWRILTLLLVGIGFATVSCWRAHRLLVLFAIACFGTMTVMGCNAWGGIVPELSVYSGIPFAIVSLLAIAFAPSKTRKVAPEVATDHVRPCPSCGYPLAPSGSGVCPECGITVAATETRSSRPAGR